MTKQTYLVKAFASVGIELPRPQKFALPDGEALVTNRTRRDDLSVLRGGLAFDIALAADDHDEALKRAQAAADSITALMALVMAAGAEHARAWIAYRQDDDGCSVVQLLEIPVYADVVRPLDTTTFRAVYDAVIAHPRSDRLLRATARYRQGLQHRMVLDRFATLYSGFEALNPVAQERYGLAKHDLRSCPECNALLPGSPGTGTRHVIQAFGSLELYRAAHKARQETVHSLTPLGETAVGADPLCEPMGAALRRAIIEIAGVAAGSAGPDRTTLEVPQHYRARVSYRIPGLQLDHLPIGDAADQVVPKVEVVEVRGSRQRQDGQLVEAIEDLTVRSVGATMSDVEWLITYEGDPDDPNATLVPIDPVT